VLILSAAPNASAQCREQLEGRSLHWIVPYPIGGGYGTYSRLLAPFLGDALGAEISVENMPSAGGTVGARAIMSAAPNGRTIGIVNVTGLLVAAQTGMPGVPDPARDFTILASITDSRQIWVTSAHSGFDNMDEVVVASERGRVLFGVRDLGTSGFVNIVAATDLLGLNFDVVAGYGGTADTSLGAIRGEVDLIANNFESLVQWIESGDLRPILQISDERISAHPSLDGVPTLGGDDGWAVLRARQLGRPIAAARADASALAALIRGARLVVAPRGLDEPLAICLRDTISATLEDSRLRELAADAGLEIRPGDADAALAATLAAAEAMHRFAPLVREAAARFSR
jgi:tripartite-type tricarboxylate transporter receptor subunit TctC